MATLRMPMRAMWPVSLDVAAVNATEPAWEPAYSQRSGGKRTPALPLDLPLGWKVEDGAMEIELLYFEGCPNWQLPGARLRETLRLCPSGECGRHSRTSRQIQAARAHAAVSAAGLSSPCL